MKCRRVLLTILMLFGCSVVLAANSIGNVRIWPAPDHTRLVFDLTAEVDHKLFSLAKPDRIVIDLQKTSLKTQLSSIKLKDTPIKQIRSARRNKDDLRVVLDLSGEVSPKSFMLSPNSQYGHRLVVDLYNQQDYKKTVTKKADLQAKKRNILVVIDPGHGGEDPGALGPSGVREKDIVLSISRALQVLINKQKGFSARLTRNGDYFIRLRERNKIAREHNADLLISIHADAFKRSKANGVSVFALSERGATSETARWLAASENTSDLIGGEGVVSLDDKSNVLAKVLLDLSMTASMKASLDIGHHVLGNLGKVARMHKKRVEQAGFVVLKSPDIPSILVETGFISNPAEASRLKTRKHQQKIARAIFRGLDHYFTEQPPPGTLLAWQKHYKTIAHISTHTIRSGDTLSAIARANNVSTSRLRHHNGLKNDMLHVGQVLKIPTT